MPSFLRYFRPAVALAGAGLDFSNLDAAGLRTTWRVRRTNTPAPDTAEIEITNLAPRKAEMITQAIAATSEPFRIRLDFRLGWNGSTSPMLSGLVEDFYAQERRGADVVTTFYLVDGGLAKRNQISRHTFKTVKIHVLIEILVRFPPVASDGTVLGALGLTYPDESRKLVESAAAKTALPNVRSVVPGLTTERRLTESMAAIGLEWRVHNGAFIAFRDGIINRPGPILRPGSEILQSTKRKDGGIEITALAHPDLEPGMQVHVKGRLYRAERITFDGDSQGESTMVVSARNSHVAG